jgi:hypothetical protein
VLDVNTPKAEHVAATLRAAGVKSTAITVDDLLDIGTGRPRGDTFRQHVGEMVHRRAAVACSESAQAAAARTTPHFPHCNRSGRSACPPPSR